MQRPEETHEHYKQRLMRSLLTQKFGFPSFRPGQKELIGSILDGRDVLGVLPTGAGKSLCYELPALMLPGLTLVVTPLISLMQDQVRNLAKTGIPAAFVNSTLAPEQEHAILSDTLRARYRILYVAPERLGTPTFLRFAKRVPITILAVDEAHCVSQWGQDFRPAYLRIPEFVDQLPARPVVAAFTATATPRTRTDISERLRLEDPRVVTTTFDRPNLTWQVVQPASRRERTDWILDWAQEHKGESGIVYCSTRKAVDELAERLEEAGISARPYHAGHSAEERERNQAAFIKGTVSVIVATNAFGMGIDKPDVRWVLHNNAPQNLEEYYQEAGRAGRDGKPSDCVLLWMEGDFRTSRRFIDEAGDNNEELDSQQRQAVRRHLSDLLEAMHAYCLSAGCLRNAILDYFGEHRTDPCGKCTNCLLAAHGRSVARDVTREARGIVAVVGEMGERLPYALGQAKVISIALGRSGPELEKVMPDEWDSFGILADSSVSAASSDRLLRQVIAQLLASRILVSGRYSSLEPGPRFSEANSPDFEVAIRRQGVRSPSSSSLSRPGRGARSHRLSAHRVHRHSTDSISFAPIDPVSVGGDIDSDGEIDPAGQIDDVEDPVEADPQADALYQKLRRVRLRLAKKAGIPAFRILTNKTLKNMVIARPTDMGSLLEVNGVGPKTAERYGQVFLDALDGDAPDDD